MEIICKIWLFVFLLFWEGFYLILNEIREIFFLFINNIVLYCIGVWLFIINKLNVFFVNFIYIVRNIGIY